MKILYENKRKSVQLNQSWKKTGEWLKHFVSFVLSIFF